MISSDKKPYGLTRLPNKRTAIILAVIAGLVFPLLSLLVIMIHQKLEITLSGILNLHVSHPEIFILYLIPAIMAIIVHFLFKTRDRDISFYENLIDGKDKIINRNAYFAKEIGEGHYDIRIHPEGEHDILGKSLLVMRENLLANHKKESEQNWISEGKNLVSNILRIYNKLEELGDHVLEHLVKYIDAIQGAIYLYHEDTQKLVSLSTFAYSRKKYLTNEFQIGYGLIGQCAYERDYIYRSEIPDDYYTISSGLLGDKKPASLLLVPLISDDHLQGVIEIASLLENIPDLTITLVKELSDIIARTIFNLRINQKTEQLLEESQKMTLELKENEEQLRENAEIMETTQKELKKTNQQLEAKILEVENARKNYTGC